MTTGLVKEQNLEKQIEKQMGGCMAGFLQIFDRHQILTGKRLCSAKRLPPSPAGDSTSESEKSAPASPAISGDLGKPIQPQRVSAQSPHGPRQTAEAELRSPPPPKSPLPLPIFELKEGARSSWKFCKEAPRLSLDSRATTDANGGLHPKSTANPGSGLVDDTTDGGGQQRRSPGVIAKLMGLEPLPNSPENMPELRRSASESRVSKDLFHSRFMTDGNINSHSKQPNSWHSNHFNNVVKDNFPIDALYADPRNSPLKKSAKVEVISQGFGNSTSSPWRAPQPRRSFFDSGDVFPEPKQSVSIYGEIEKRIRMRAMEEPSKDLETLKQILEALQLKGLLHSKPPPPQQNQLRHRNFVYDESSIVLRKPSPLNAGSHGRGGRRSYSLAGETSPSPSPRRARSGRSLSPTTRSVEGSVNPTRSNSPVKRKPVNVGTQRRLSESMENRRAVHSPKLSSRKSEPERSPRTKKSTAEIHRKEKVTTVVVTEDEYSSISGSSITPSTTDTERWKVEEYREGNNLLERCDKLLHSIAEIGAPDTQPSPVSVLDSSFYKDGSLTPSPVTTKRNFDFKDQDGELEEEIWSPVISPIRSKRLETTSDDCDFVYVSNILRAAHYLPEESDVFLLFEKQQYLKGNDTSKISKLRRKLIFDTINEIIDRNERLPPWKAVVFSRSSNGDTIVPNLDRVWLEFQRIRECDVVGDLFETVCAVLKKDLTGDAITGWGDCPVEMSEAVLDIERLIFKDMICEIIGDLSALESRGTLSSIRRKLVF